MDKSNIFKAIMGKRQDIKSNTDKSNLQDTQTERQKNKVVRTKVFKMVPGIQARGRYYDKGDPYHEEWLGMYRSQKEIVLAWLRAVSVSAPIAEGGQTVKAAWRYLLTSDRSMLVGFLKDRSVCLYELPSVPIEVEDKIGRYTIKAGEYNWKASIGDGRYYREISRLPGLDRLTRIREAARLNSIYLNARKRRVELALWLIRIIVKELADPIDCMTGVYLESVIASMECQTKSEPDIDDLREPLGRCMKELFQSSKDDAYLSRWAKEWNVLPEFQFALSSFLLKNYPQYPEAPISLFLQARNLKVEKDLLRQIERDIAFAELFIEINQRNEAVKLIRNSLSALPKPVLEDLLPLELQQKTSVSTNKVRCRLLEALAKTGEYPNSPDPAAVAELAMFQPLDTNRLSNLIHIAQDPLRKRAQEMLVTLKEKGASPSSKPWIAAKQVKPLTEEIIKSKLPYPQIAEEGTIDALKAWIGKAKVPDYKALKSYSDRVTQKNYPEVLHALSDASLAFGISGVEAYVTRGERSAGIRAYEGKPSFLLIGYDHLEADSDLFMNPLELRFAIGAEVAHLHFHHTRLTSSEVWDGVLSKGKQALEIIAVLSGPLAVIGNAARGLQRLTRFERLIQKTEIITSSMKKVTDMVGFAKNVTDAAENVKNKKSGQSDKLLEDEENVLKACRQMQLTADRAGLILCGSIQAAVRAMFLTSRHYASELPTAIRYSLLESLTRKDSKGKLLHKELALRVAALGAFYLSDHYKMLSLALIRNG